jgi:prepilin-type N-terminal cleavage/methylation domain-containing protein
VNMRGAIPTARRRSLTGFTLIEVMLVIGIMGLLVGMSAPSFIRAQHREPMRRALTGVMEACVAARAQAILQGKTVAVVFHPLDGSFSVEGGAAGLQPGSVTSGQFGDAIGIEMLDVNLMEFREADVARVRFFPNGTCDEFTLVLHSDRNEWRKLSVESTTGIVSIGDVR